MYIYIYMGVSAFWSLCLLRVFVSLSVYVCVCDIKSEYSEYCKKPRHVLDVSKLDALLHASVNLMSIHMRRSIIS